MKDVIQELDVDSGKVELIRERMIKCFKEKLNIDLQVRDSVHMLVPKACLVNMEIWQHKR